MVRTTPPSSGKDDGLQGMIACLSTLAAHTLLYVSLLARSFLRPVTFFTLLVFSTRSFATRCSPGAFRLSCTVPFLNFPGSGVQIGSTCTHQPHAGRSKIHPARPAQSRQRG